MRSVVLLSAMAWPVWGQLPVGGVDMAAFREHLITEDAPAAANGSVRVTFLGTATLLFDDGDTQVLVDGFFTRPRFITVSVGSLKTDTALVDAALKKAGATRVKAVLVCHSHYDHALDCAYVAKSTGATLYGSASTLNIGRGGEVKENQLKLFDPGKPFTVGAFAITPRAGKHSPPIPGVNDDLGQTIDAPLMQPAGFRAYKEGGAFDFTIQHGTKTFYVNASSNFVKDALKGVTADVAFLGIGSLGLQSKSFKDEYYAETVGTLKPKRVIPIHWDNFMKPLSDNLEGMSDVKASFEFLIGKTKADGIKFGLLQGEQAILLK